MFQKCYSLIQKYKEYKFNRQSSLGNIYMFHQVNNDKSTWKDNSCCISQDNFNYFVKELVKSNAKLKSISALYNDNVCDYVDKDCVFITFDDAYDDVYFNCFPLFKDLGIPFTIFITVDLLGKSGYLTEKMVQEMLDSGLCQLGAHTITHCLLRKQPENVVEYELNESKKILTELFHMRIDIMAYPYGSLYACSNGNVKMCKMVGYLCGFSTLNCHLTYENINDKFFIPRKNVNDKNYKTMLLMG